MNTIQILENDQNNSENSINPDVINPKNIFNLFTVKYKYWITKKSNLLSQHFSTDVVDEKQNILEYAWKACQHESFSPKNDLQGVGWIYQGVVYKINTRYMLGKRNKKNNFKEILCTFVEANDDLSAEYSLMKDVNLRNQINSDKQLDAFLLLEKIKKAIKKLQEEQRFMFSEIINPSKGFCEFMEKRIIQGKRLKSNEKFLSSTFCTCNLQDIIGYMNHLDIEASKYTFLRGVQLIKKMVPEIKEYCSK